MSTVQSSPFNKPECGDMHQLGLDKVQAHLRDVLGGLIDLQVVGTDPGVVGPVVGPLSGNYAPTAGTLNPDGTFFIIPETDNAVYCVVLADGTEFTITAVQSHAYLGQVIPYRVLKVLKQGTTGSFSVVY
jgi:hypothetical protein